MDYESSSEADVLFLSDSLKSQFNSVVAFPTKDMKLLESILVTLDGDATFEFAGSVKCPSVKDGDLTTEDMHKCRVHLGATIDKIKPKLVFVCGNQAMKMLIKKSGISGKTPKRGRQFPYTSPGGHETVVVPLFHPYSVISEPKNKYLFELDIKTAYNTVILNKRVETDFSYEIIQSIPDLIKIFPLTETKDNIAIDIETDGLDFLHNNIHTVAITSSEGTWVIPYLHKEHVWSEGDLDVITEFLEKLMANPNNKKIGHNLKFDLKFMWHLGLRDFKNIVDTKLMKHLLDENSPSRLSDCVHQYFSEEFETIKSKY